MSVVELIGYLASALIVLSLLMASLWRLRIINLVGAIVFTVYGGLIGSLPVMLTNGAIVLIDLYYLARMVRDKAADAYFEVVSTPPTSPLLQRFVAFHDEDIARFQPDFTGIHDDHLAWAVLRDGIPVGVVLASQDGEVATIDLDYVTPAHRDQRAGTRFYATEALFAPYGITRLRTRAQVEAHRRYVTAMGFAPAGADVFERPAP
ncbi:MAG: GNAT family N-acetyltransferase [Nitriliruptoraceae bacterium]